MTVGPRMVRHDLSLEQSQLYGRILLLHSLNDKVVLFKIFTKNGGEAS